MFRTTFLQGSSERRSPCFWLSGAESRLLLCISTYSVCSHILCVHSTIPAGCICIVVVTTIRSVNRFICNIDLHLVRYSRHHYLYPFSESYRTSRLIFSPYPCSRIQIRKRFTFNGAMTSPLSKSSGFLAAYLPGVVVQLTVSM